MNSPEKMSTAEASSRWRALQTLHLDPEIANLTAPNSILVCTYPCKDVLVTDEQRAVLRNNRESVAARGEPFQSRFTPDEFVALLAAHGFEVTDHLTDHDLNDRYNANRPDGFCAGVPARIIRARR